MRKNILFTLVILIILVLIYVSLPFLFMGPAAPLFTVNNHDERGHNVHVEVFDQTGTRIAMEEEYLQWAEDITYPRTLWQWLPISQEYTFEVSIDGKTETTHSVAIGGPHEMVDISVHGFSDSANEIYVEVQLVQVA